MKTTTLPLKNSLTRSPFRHALLLVPVVLGCFALLPRAQAQDGGYPRLNTAEGELALYAIITNSANTGASNTALGYGALLDNTAGSDNTATGLDALGFNTTGNDNTATGSVALYNNTNASKNTAKGYEARCSNSSSINITTAP